MTQIFIKNKINTNIHIDDIFNDSVSNRKVKVSQIFNDVNSNNMIICFNYMDNNEPGILPLRTFNLTFYRTTYMFDDTDIIQDSVWINPVDNRKVRVISVKGIHNTGNMLVDFIYVDNNDVGYAISKVFKLVFEKVK